MEAKISAEKARDNRILIREDIEKYELAKANLAVQMAQYDAAIRECRLALADIDRLEAGVEYPEPKKPEAKKEPAAGNAQAPAPEMDKPVGGE